ncbi:uncharacterized protein PHALS_13679 [Plasmopara halstedii]|uniref:Uncharacterized protein n=1 Tax=Plasmopara halstedii TaxID=4781 RepID=A0A0P1APR6_PLAHL|nr:uncharacterized protein PHALS_13679 [Plasmopara halstedii]CEG43486.1 hypothetical protein PHALS_13679 [Plasmopara halstedii]|eukprot:XP_024579855.1 hypothetical protein PHALS_13679 [Plasmopara halstedii]
MLSNRTFLAPKAMHAGDAADMQQRSFCDVTQKEVSEEKIASRRCAYGLSCDHLH